MALDRDFYYESLKGSYAKLEAWAKRVAHPPIWARLLQVLWVPVAVAWVFCLIPIAPYVIAVAQEPSLGVVGSVTLFGVTWIVLAAAATGLMAAQVWVSERTWYPAPPVKLSPDQLTFVEAYSAHRELQMYLTSRQEDSRRQALSHARRVFDVDGDALIDAALRAPRMWVRKGEPVREQRAPDRSLNLQTYSTCGWWHQVRAAELLLDLPSEMPWLALATDDRDRLSALTQLGPRVLANLEAEANLSDVQVALGAFLDYVFHTMPNPDDWTVPDVRPWVDALVAAVARLPQGATVEPVSSPRTREQSHRGFWASQPAVRVLVYFALILAPLAVAVNTLRLVLSFSDDTLVGATVAADAVISGLLAAGTPGRPSTVTAPTESEGEPPTQPV